MLDKVFEQIIKLFSNVALHNKILIITVGFIMLFAAGITFEMRNTVYKALLTELDNQGRSVTSNLAARSADLVLTDNVFDLHILLQQTIDNNEVVKYAFVLDENNQVVAHSFLRGFPEAIRDVHQLTRLDDISKVILDIEGVTVHDYAVPIIDGKAGIARVGIDESTINRSIETVIRTILITTILIAITAILAVYILTWLIARPLVDLVDATKKIAEGDYSQRVTVKSKDEVGKLALAFNDMSEVLQYKDIQTIELMTEVENKEFVRKKLLAKVISAQEQERKRISRELHDETGQLLSSQMLYLQNIANSSDETIRNQNIEKMRELILHTIKEVKLMSQQLRPSVLDDMGLLPAIKHLVEQYQNILEADIELVIHGRMTERRLVAVIEIAIYRVLQEALTNTHKYAEAKNVSVIMSIRPTDIQIIVEDDGIGFDVNRTMSSISNDEHMGLHGIYERIELLNGSVEIESQVNVGTTIYITVPISYEIEKKGVH